MQQQGQPAGAPRPGNSGDPPPGSRPNAGAARPVIAVPSYQAVQAAERSAPPNLFRPSAAARAAAAPHAPSSSGALGAWVNPMAFVDGDDRSSSGPSPSAAPQQQRQQQQHGWNAAQPQQQQHYQQPHHLAQQQGQQRPLPQPPFPSPPQQQQQQHASYPPPQHHQNASTGQVPTRPPPAAPPFNPNAILVNRRQEGNPVLKFIRNVRWQYGDIVPDYQLGQSTAALFLSLRYHLLRPEYIYSRLKELGRAYRLRVVLVCVDTEDAVEALAQVTRAAIGNEATLLCGFSVPECARYLETLKSYEKKPAEIIQKDLGTDYVSRATSALTTVRGVNKTDVKTLGDRFGSLAAVMQASAADLQACPGVGPLKARRMFETFHEPFRRNVSVQAPAAAAVRTQHTQQAQQAQQQQGGFAVALDLASQEEAGQEESDQEGEQDAFL